MSPKLTVFALIAFFIPFVTAAHFGRHHHEVAHRARGDVVIHKRQSFDGAKFTFYDVGLGACGQTNVASDFIVAINIAQFGGGYPGPNCFKSITIQYGGKTAEAVIMDRCVACPSNGGLDFSRGLFDYFADESVGVIYGTWWFSGSGGETTTSSTWTPPTTTSTWEQPTTTSTPAYTPPTTSSTPAYTTSSTPSTPSTTTFIASTSIAPTTSIYLSSSTFSTNYNTSSIGGLAVPTGEVESPLSVTNPQNIVVINNILVEIGILLTMAEKV